MRKDPTKSSSVLGLFFFFTILFNGQLLAQKTAEVVSNDTSFCQAGLLEFKIKFTGNAPFGFVIKDQEGNMQVETNPIFENELVNGVYTHTFQVSTNKTYDLYEFFDNDNAPWTVNNGYKTVSGSTSVSIDQRTNPNAGADVNLECGYVANLAATPEDPAHKHYWKASADGNFDEPNNATTSFTAHTEGTYTLWFMEENGVCTDSSSVNVQLLGSPKATLSGAATICSTDENPDNITLQVNYQSNYAPYAYIVSDGTSNFPRTGLNSTPDAITVPATGNQTFVLSELRDTRAGKQCYANAEDLTGAGEAVVTDLKPAAFPGDTKVVCKNNTTLDATIADGNTGLWSTTAIGVTFSDAGSPTTPVSVDAYGFKTLTWTETEPNMNCAHSNNVTINFAEPPALTFSKDTAICEGGTATLELAATGNVPWTLYYSDGSNSTNTTLNQSSESRTFNPEATTSYLLERITGTYGCETTLNKAYVVRVDDMPTANAGIYDEAICSNQVNLNAVPSIAKSSGYWQGNGTFGDIYAPSTTFSAANYSDNTLTWTETNSDNAYCIDTDEVVIRFDEQPETADAGNDQILYLRTSAMLDALEPPVGTGTWTTDNSNNTLLDPSYAKTTVDGLTMGEQTLTWTVSNGICEDRSDQVLITIEGLTTKNGFSPNGDGANDFFIVGGADQIPDNELLVFDRNGKLVFSAKNFMQNPETEKGWDGKDMAGQPVKDGTYYYTFTGVNVETRKEYLIIKRTRN
jgi:gliding motility-associated-like protein